MHPLIFQSVGVLVALLGAAMATYVIGKAFCGTRRMAREPQIDPYSDDACHLNGARIKLKSRKS